MTETEKSSALRDSRAAFMARCEATKALVVAAMIKDGVTIETDVEAIGAVGSLVLDILAMCIGQESEEVRAVLEADAIECAEQIQSLTERSRASPGALMVALATNLIGQTWVASEILEGHGAVRQ